jgi:adenylyl-sulfate kinase
LAKKLFIGRWAPFHDGHKYIIDSYANNGVEVVIGVRDTPIDNKNPFSAEVRKKRIEQIYEDNKNVEVIVVPDIDEVCVGRGVGYAISSVPPKIENISGTKEREKKDQDTFNSGKGSLVWFTGPPCSGKTTLADGVHEMLKQDGIVSQRLDGDIIRKSLCADLGFSPKDRAENLRRVAEVAKTLVNHGVVVLASFVSPSEDIREEIFKEFEGKDIVVHVSTPQEVCERRDTKGMYKLAREGKIQDFTGVQATYEKPSNASFAIDTFKRSEQGNIERTYNAVKKIYENIYS